MKKILSITLLAASLMWQSCDKIDAPYGQAGGSNPVPTDSVVQKVLLEDFTGFHCTNCPEAHRKAQQLKDLYGDRLIVLGLHVGIFATPNIWGPLYTYDFRNQTATDIYAAFANNQPLPIGCVNREPYQGSVALFNGSWPSAVVAELAKTPRAGIEFDTISYDPSSRTISGSVTVDFLTTITDEVSICFYTVEDSIVKPQLDDGTDIPAYTHRHVLRGSLNTTWGESIGANNAGGTSKQVTFTGSYGPADAMPEHGHVYAILIDKTTRKVIQVEETKIQ